MAERVHRRTVIVGGISLLAGGLLLRPRMAAAQESRPSVFPDASDQQNKQLLSAAKQFINPAYLSDSFSLGQGLVETYRGGAKVWTSAVSERAGKMQPFNIVNLYDQAGLLDETLIINADDHNRHTITLDMLPDNPFTARIPTLDILMIYKKLVKDFMLPQPFNGEEVLIFKLYQEYC